MSRRHAAEQRKVTPDAKYGDELLAKFINIMMLDGKRFAAEGIVYGAFDMIEQKGAGSPLEVFKKAIDNLRPSIEVRSRRVGGATYQVPKAVRPARQYALAFRWLRDAVRARNERTTQERLFREIMDAAENRGNAVKKREDTHKMAEANRAFAHFAW